MDNEIILLWFVYELYPQNSCVEGLVPIQGSKVGVLGKELDPEGSDLSVD
jgi:hypothetical protein